MLFSLTKKACQYEMSHVLTTINMSESLYVHIPTKLLKYVWYQRQWTSPALNTINWYEIFHDIMLVSIYISKSMQMHIPTILFGVPDFKCNALEQPWTSSVWDIFQIILSIYTSHWAKACMHQSQQACFKCQRWCTWTDLNMLAFHAKLLHSHALKCNCSIVLGGKIFCSAFALMLSADQ